jgi:hypothetical protein
MPKNDHDITNKNKPIQAESRLEPESSLDSLKVRTDDKLGVPLHSESRKTYINRGNVFVLGSETATSGLRFSSRMIRGSQALVVCGNDISMPRLCLDASHKTAMLRSEKDLLNGPRKERSHPIKIKIRAIEKDKPSPAG